MCLRRCKGMMGFQQERLGFSKVWTLHPYGPVFERIRIKKKLTDTGLSSAFLGSWIDLAFPDIAQWFL